MGSIIALSTAKRVSREPEFPQNSRMAKCDSSMPMLNLGKAMFLRNQIKCDPGSCDLNSYNLNSFSRAEEFILKLCFDCSIDFAHAIGKL